MPLPPSSNIRLTITVRPEVHAIFKRLADSTNDSLSKAMGDWLAETAPAAELMATKMQEAREEPKRVMREMHAYALGLTDVTAEMLDRVKNGPNVAGVSEPATARRTRVAPTPPRLVIRGGKSPAKGKKTP